MTKRTARKIVNHVYEYTNFFLINPKRYSDNQIRKAFSICRLPKSEIEFIIRYFKY